MSDFGTYVFCENTFELGDG